MFTLKHEFETILLMIIAACSAVLLLNFHGGNNQKKYIYLPVVAPLIFVTPTPAPLISPIAHIQTITTNITSADGTAKLLLQTKIATNGTTDYSLFLTSLQNLAFYKISLQKGSITLPFNSWSIDNKYFFVTQTTDMPHFLVFQASLNSFSAGKQYLDISPLFVARYPNYKGFQVTGWASETLLIITTQNTDGSEGQSFWFDVPSESFIPLATKF